jgi:hypothetical protein
MRCFVLLILASLAIGQGLYIAREGFNPRKLHCFHKEEGPPLSSEMQEILSQPFTFLGKGRQCFAFASQDGKYVLKCPRTNIFETPFWHTRKESMRKQFVFESFRLAAEELQEETGVILFHRGGGSGVLTLIDRLGCCYKFPIDQTVFVLQHRFPLWTPAYLKACDKRPLLQGLVDLVAKRASHGIVNRDGSFLKNYAWDGEKVYQIDVGDFFRLDWAQEDILHKALEDTLSPVCKWLPEEEATLLRALMQKKIEEHHPEEEKEDRKG